MLMAVLDGVQNKIRPGDPLDKDIYDLQPEELEKVPTTPKSLEGSLDALRPTMSSCFAATCSHPTSSTPGSGTSKPTRSRPSGFAPTRTSSRFITTCERNRLWGLERP